MFNAVMLIAVLVGVATWYPEDVYGGRPLFCDTPQSNLAYNRDTWRWVAVSDEMYRDGWQCGDMVRVQFEDRSFYARALDAGPLDHYNIDGVPIVVDVPEYFWPYDPNLLSAPVTVFNESLANRKLTDVQFGHLER